MRWILATIAVVICLAGPALADREHTVRSGQTLAQIARRYRVDVRDVQAANRMRNARIRPGQVLSIPSRGVYYVRRGETLSHVARRADVSVDDLRRANRLRRGRTLRVGQRLVLPGHTDEDLRERDWGDPSDPGKVTIMRRGERTEVRLVDTDGRVMREGLAALGHAMRRGDQDAPFPPNPRLALLLGRLSDEFGGRPIHVVSGFREAGGYTRESSRHTQGRATDIHIPGVPNRAIWEFCRRMDHTGCGFYPRSNFVHVDARRTRTQWVDWSGPGRRARYGTLDGPTNRRRRRSMPRPRATSDLPLSIVIVEPNGAQTELLDQPGEEPQDIERGEDPASRPRPLWREW